MGISKQGMDVLNSFIFDIFHRICKESKTLLQFQRKSSLSARDIQTSIQLIFPEEMAKAMTAELCRCITTYHSKLGEGTSESKQSRCGLTLPIGRIERYIKHYGYTTRVEGTAAMAVAAALECVLMELLKETCDVMNEQDRIRITPRHLLLVMKNDKDFSAMTKSVCVPNGGVLPEFRNEKCS